uniref:Uncharacterized protein n=1 Tax=Noctiluca scintillans TaxID=2966 RepID=A0A7S1B2P1_NOCSC|mmetsp:Transcript_9983/g.27953  ORF Transcript_9983/g.27953 Transcript_9983/m.27953 type:complete len:315 (+) Transcript_9983:80-1024(+)|eukprot:CAMPEP_0194502534 /NCGR_PEP_ID=MMETSP0253-20130528/26069_1 /TAXON_ID=2966 /ORGANISM="Noctiluca scintillans" /LENGTH=314 /DNA_ID=CAMNT_0039344695 /DNA_START=77 /DNA_END=1021 /DNA_ORIENTATION=-
MADVQLSAQQLAACDVISHALAQCTSYPEVPRNMLLKTLPFTAAPAGESLHRFQVEVLSTVRCVLQEARLAAVVDMDAAHSKVAEAETQVEVAASAAARAVGHETDAKVECSNQEQRVQQASDEVIAAEAELRHATEAEAERVGREQCGEEDLGDEVYTNARALGAWAWVEVATRKHRDAVAELRHAESAVAERGEDILEQQKQVKAARAVLRDRSSLTSFEVDRVESFDAALRALEDLGFQSGAIAESDAMLVGDNLPPVQDLEGRQSVQLDGEMHPCQSAESSTGPKEFSVTCASPRQDAWTLQSVASPMKA